MYLVEVIKSSNGKKIGEIYQHDGGWGCLHYKSDQGSEYNDTREDALQTLNNLHNQFKR